MDITWNEMHILAQKSGMAGVLIWALLLIALLVVLFIAVEGLKRWIGRETQETGAVGGFTLADLRQLHREGKLSDEEFEATRRRLVAAAQAEAARKAHTDAAPRGEPKMAGEPDGSDNNVE